MLCYACIALLFYVMLCYTISHATVHSVMSFREISCCNLLTHLILNQIKSNSIQLYSILLYSLLFYSISYFSISTTSHLPHLHSSERFEWLSLSLTRPSCQSYVCSNACRYHWQQQICQLETERSLDNMVWYGMVWHGVASRVREREWVGQCVKNNSKLMIKAYIGTKEVL